MTRIDAATILTSTGGGRGFDGIEVQRVACAGWHGQAFVVEGAGAARFCELAQGTILFARTHEALQPFFLERIVLAEDDSAIEVLEAYNERIQAWERDLAAGNATLDDSPRPLRPVIRIVSDAMVVDTRSGLVTNPCEWLLERFRFITHHLDPSPELLE